MRNVVFFHSFVASKARKVSSEKRGGAEDRLPKMPPQFCITLLRESDLEVEIAKNWQARSAY